MIELSSVEWDHSFMCYVATFSNGEFCMLESKNLREAEQEAERIVEHYNEE